MASLIPAAINSLGEAETGIANKNIGEYNQHVNERNAILVEQQGSAEALQASRLSEKRIGLGRANYGASGVTMEGTAGDVLAESASNAKLNQQNIKYNAHLKAIGFKENAVLDAYRAHYMLTASQYAAAGPLISGGAKEYSNRPNSTPGSGTPVGGNLGSTPDDQTATSEYGVDESSSYGGDLGDDF